MTKTPEELTEDWKAGELHKRFDEPKLFYCKTDNGIEILKTWGYKNLEFLSMADEVFEPVDDVQILAPVPTYDEYKAMQLRIENEKRLLDYNGELLNRLKETEETVKSLFQQIAGSSKTIEEMKEKLAEHRRYCCCSENEVMRLKLAEMKELLKGCKLSTFKIYDRLRFSDENEITPADLINAVDEIKPMLWGILNSINAALGGSEEK